VTDERARSFGRAAAEYEAGRPSYPVEAVAWLLGGVGLDVADVGAGTGKLTRALLARGARVVAVEPDEGMRTALTAALPGVRALPGAGEALPLPDASVDRVTYGQAWHWVDPEQASAEAARVLRPGGALCLLWNIRDERDPWVRRLGEVMTSSAAEEMIAHDRLRIGSGFAPAEHRTFPWANRLTAEQLVAMAASRSYVITATEQRRAAILDGVRALAGERVDTDGLVELPYVTHAFRATRQDG
jgi:SAM-dependent methyltransferase